MFTAEKEVSSRPERSAVEGPAVSFSSSHTDSIAPGTGEPDRPPTACYSDKPGSMFLRPRLKGPGLLSCYLFDGVLHHPHGALTNRSEGLRHCRGHGSRESSANQTLSSSLRRHINAFDRL